LTQDKTLAQKAYHTEQYCLRTFGFQANAKLPLQQNFNLALKKVNAIPLQQPSNLTFHNLCKDTKLPIGAKALLGLNLKFCLANNSINQDISKTLRKMAYSIRTKCQLDNMGISDNPNFEKQIYAKNKNWNPGPAPVIIEEKLEEFEKALNEEKRKLILKHSGRNLSNLTSSQRQVLHLLKHNKHLTIKPTDKNLGPAVMETTVYTRQMLSEHLLTKDYKQLSATEAKRILVKFKNTLQKLIANNQNLLSKAELLYFKRNLIAYHRIPIIYGLPKVHKTPLKLRPVVSGSNSLSAVASTWLDYKMKILLPHVQSYIKNSTEVIKDLKALHIPKGARLFSADATAMYTNINTNLGISAIREFITSHREKLPPDFPTELFLLVLTLVMKLNVFTFADTFWLQMVGTAMGTPVACSYATVSFGHYENNTVLPQFSTNLIYYKRYIDDVIGIWMPSERNNSETWTKFKDTLCNWGQLKWTVEEPTSSINFLDLNISIIGSSIHTSTFQKPLNLYLYIPPLSAHPPSCFKGLIFGELKRYWTQNNPVNFIDILTKFITRLCDRGHKIETLAPLITQAAATLNRQHVTTSTAKPDNQGTLYIHWPFHPHGIQRHTIRQLFNTILQPYLPFNRMQVAMSRPKNLKDVLTRAALTLPDDLSLPSMLAQANVTT